MYRSQVISRLILVLMPPNNHEVCNEIVSASTQMWSPPMVLTWKSFQPCMSSRTCTPPTRAGSRSLSGDTSMGRSIYLHQHWALKTVTWKERFRLLQAPGLQPGQDLVLFHSWTLRVFQQRSGYFPRVSVSTQLSPPSEFDPAVLNALATHNELFRPSSSPLPSRWTPRCTRTTWRWWSSSSCPRKPTTSTWSRSKARRCANSSGTLFRYCDDGFLFANFLFPSSIFRLSSFLHQCFSTGWLQCLRTHWIRNHFEI